MTYPDTDDSNHDPLGSILAAGHSEACTLSELRDIIEQTAPERLPRLLPILERDPRRGAQNLARSASNRWQKHVQQRQAFLDRWVFEDAARELGHRCVAGVDEAGRGPLAGPVVAAAVVLPRSTTLYGLNDSKQLSPEQREGLYDQIRREALACAISAVDVDYIDRHNILQATFEAMRRATGQITPRPDFFLVDGSLEVPDIGCPQQAVVGGDSHSNSIAAASILAKVYRDRLMVQFDANYPQYGFASNKGYATPEHLEALALHGRCPIHRQSFRPVVDDNELGRWGEEMAALHLEGGGVSIVTRNYATSGGEVDIICRDADELVFVEVRTGRPGRRIDDLLGSIDLEKQARILSAAHEFARSVRYRGRVRFDAMAIQVRVYRSPGNEQWVPEIVHLRRAFGPDVL